MLQNEGRKKKGKRDVLDGSRWLPQPVGELGDSAHDASRLLSHGIAEQVQRKDIVGENFPRKSC